MVKKVVIVLSVFLVLPAAGWAGNQSSEKNNVPRVAQVYEADQDGLVRVNVVYRSHEGRSQAARTVASGKAKRIRKHFRNFPAQTLEVAEADLPQVLAELDAEPAVLSVEPDWVATISAQTLPWGVDRVEADWTTFSGMTGVGVKVAVIDTGIWSSDGTPAGVHPDLIANYRGGYDFIALDAFPEDVNGHGTHVAGTIAAVNNTIGVVGVAPGVDLYALKACTNAGSCPYSEFADAVDWAITNGIQVVNYSAAGTASSTLMEAACQRAFDAGLTIVAAAGNSNTAVGYPAAYSTVIAVGATTTANLRASFSNYGAALDLVAPGVDIYSTFLGEFGFSGYYTMSGTSMASPHVAGSAALLVAAGTTDPTAIRDRLTATATDLGAAGRDNAYGYGLVNAAAAVSVPTVLNFLAPTAGAILPSGSVFAVDWDPFPGAATYRVTYSLNGGTTWVVATDDLGTPATALVDDRLDWRVPVAVTTTSRCLLAVTGYDAGGVLLRTLKSPAFTVEVLRVDSPLGGEILAAGQQHLVTWTLNEGLRPAAGFSLYSSVNGGTSWTLAATLGPAERQYLWTAPVLAAGSTNCLFLVKATDAAGLVAYGKSARFTVEVIRFDTPVAGEILPAGQDYTVRWTLNGTVRPVAGFSLYATTNGGTSWSKVASLGPVDREYLWRVPALGATSTRCQLLIVAADVLGRRVAAIRSPVFTIEVVRFDAPAAGGTLTAGSGVLVQWTVNATVRPIASIGLYYSRDRGRSWTRQALLAPADRSFSWTVPAESVLQSDRRLLVILRDSLGRSIGAARVLFAVQPPI
jgi:subtilisin family serine protease